MKPYQEKLEGGYRLIRIRNLKRIILIFLFVLAIVGWAYIWFSNHAGLKPFYVPLDAVFPWLLIMLLIALAMGISFRDLEIRYAKRDGQRYLMARNSQRRAIWTIAIAATVMIILVLPQTQQFTTSELSTVRNERINGGQTLQVGDFTNQDAFGLTKVEWFMFSSDQNNVRVTVFKDGIDDTKQVDRTTPWRVAAYNEGESLRTFNATVFYPSGPPVNFVITVHVRLASALVTAIPILMMFFIALNAVWYIRLVPIRKKFAAASIYSVDYAQDMDKGEQVYSKYDVRGRPQRLPFAREAPPPPEAMSDLPPPPPVSVEGEPIPLSAVAGAPTPPSPVARPERAVVQPEVREFDVFIEEGSKLFTEGDFEGALKDFDSALAIEPGNITALIARGTVLVKLVRENEALDAFNRVLAVESSNEKALHSKSKLLMDLHQWSDATKALDSYLATKPADADALRMKGDALLAMGRRNDAALAYETALNLQPDNDELKLDIERARLDVASLLSRAMVATASGNLDGALGFYDEILRYEPSNSRALSGKAGVLRRLGKTEEAIAALDAVVATDPGNPGALLERARLHLEEGHLTEAFDSAEKLVRVSPDDARGWVIKGDALAEMERFDEGRESYNKALALEPDNPDAKGRLDFLEARSAGIAQGTISRELDDIKGIGPAKIRSLYEAGFRTMEDLKKASVADLNKVKGISRRLAEDIVQHFKGIPEGSASPP